jgi:hypothetical protein
MLASTRAGELALELCDSGAVCEIAAVEGLAQSLENLLRDGAICRSEINEGDTRFGRYAVRRTSFDGSVYIRSSDGHGRGPS